MHDFHFDKATVKRARIGVLSTPHGQISTPNFIFCATKACIKGLSSTELPALGCQIILSNTYHLLLQPGAALIKQAGGLHQFMQWQGPLLTDSGGYQIFSMGHGGVDQEIKGSTTRSHQKTSLLKILEEGALFRSYVDGATVLLTPESSAQAQIDLGADLIVQLDECTPFHVSQEYTTNSMRRSARWGDRFLRYFQKYGCANRQKIYGTLQGGIYPALREESAQYLESRPFFGTAFGGSLGQNKQDMYQILNTSMPLLPEKRPVHLLGIGHIEDIFYGVLLGIDTFDCVSPTRIARHGWAICPTQISGLNTPYINLKKSTYKEDFSILQKDFPYSKSYLHHLIRAKETSAGAILSAHNIGQMMLLFSQIRETLGKKSEKEFWNLANFWIGEKRSENLLRALQ